MAVQNPFFGKRDNDSFSSRNSAAGLSHASGAGTGGYPQNNAGLAASASGGVRVPGASVTSVAEESRGSKLTVGPNIKLKGVEITDCDTLVVEGTVEATMNSRVIQIAEQGAFHGTAEIDIAEIYGKFDGTLTVRQRLVIYGSGRVSGKIRYGKVVIEEGGELTGQIDAGTAASQKLSLPVAGKVNSPASMPTQSTEANSSTAV